MADNDPFTLESQRCRAAQQKWSALTVRDRLAPIREFRSLLVDNAERLADAVHADVFRAPNDVIATDILPVAAAMQYAIKHAPSLLKPVKAPRPPLWLMGCKDVIHKRPHGLVGIIGTWNYPIYLNAIPIVHALIAGNGVLWKPSEHSTRSSQVMSELFTKAGLPADLLITLPATREAGPQLAEADIDFLQFTGSDTVGRMIAKRLGERLIPSILELSGVDASIIMADADPAFAAKAVWFGTSLNAGQTCLAVRRVFVARPIYDAFVANLKTHVDAGPKLKLVLPSQAELLKSMTSKVQAAGGVVLTRVYDDGSPAVTYYLEPPMETAIDQAACFLPATSVRPFDSIDDVIARHEAGEFGLSCSLFTSNPSQAEVIARRLRVGSVIVNDLIAPTAHPATPFGGRRASGWGVTQGAEGLLAMTVPQVVTLRSGTFRPHYETGKDNSPIIRGLLQATHSRGWGSRIKGMWQTIRAMLTNT